MTGIYIHIPFCLRKCPYCDFYSGAADGTVKEAYVKAVIRNISDFKNRGICVDTVYFGGGTPSLLSEEQIGRIISACNESFVMKGPEITMECNPCTVDYDKLCGYRGAGVNRLSFGIQSAQDRELAAIGRLHDFAQAEKTVENAVKAGFDNISGDVMLGLPEQTQKSLENTLELMCSMPLSHISAYMLKIEEGTPFDCDEIRNVVADEDTLCDMYMQTAEFLKGKGFEHYEISNFALDGKYSRHNLKYWQGEEYIGIGAAAHSFFDGRRYCCPADRESFISQPVQTKQILEESPDKASEYVMLGLRLSKGISLEKLKDMDDDINEDDIRNMKKFAERFAENGLAVISGDSISLTAKGFLVSNEIIGEFLDMI